MAMDTKAIGESTWRFTEDGISFFLLHGENEALFINSGTGIVNLHSLSQQFTDRKVSLLSTSSSSSLLGGNDEFSLFYMSPSDSFLYYRKLGRLGIVKPVYDGSVIELGKRKLEIISFPGLTPGAVLVLDYLTGSLFSGLSITSDVIDLSSDYSDIRAFLLSVRRLNLYRGKYDTIYPSSGRMTLSASILEHLEETAMRIIRKDIRGEERDGKIFFSDGFVTLSVREEESGKR